MSTTKKTTKKKTTRKKSASKGAAKQPAKTGAGASKQKREAGTEAAHTGTVVRGDGKRVKVTVPKDEAQPAAKPARKGAKKPNGKEATAPKRVSLLDAAAVVLKDAKAPMQAKAIVDRVVERGLWKPGAGKTPHATLYAAMTREIAAKGAASRFEKVDRGLFEAGKGGKA